jgi:hypothetical protein
MQIPLDFDETKHCKIPLLNRKKVVCGYAIVDIEDYDQVSKLRWNLNKDYVQGCLKLDTVRKPIKMHQYILRASKKSLIDHKNQIKNDNRRSNLRFVNASQNAQNRKKLQRVGVLSQFIGVAPREKGRWSARYSKIHLGTFNSEKAAAYIYDTFVLKYLGPDSKINNITKPDDFKVFVRKTHDLVINGEKMPGLSIIKKEGKPFGYTISIKYKNFKRRTTSKYLKNALLLYNKWQQELKDIKLQELIDIANTPILRNKDGVAILKCYNGKTKTHDDVLVDDDVYTRFITKSCYSDGFYPTINYNNRCVFLHRLIMNEPEEYLVDHMDRNRLNALRSNLRNVPANVNSHNKTKSVTALGSKYVGVTFENEKYRVTLVKDGIKYEGGSYKLETVAAWARNQLAIQVYGKFASLNDVKLEGYIWKSNRAYTRAELENLEQKMEIKEKLQKLKEETPKKIKKSKFIGVEKHGAGFRVSVTKQNKTYYGTGLYYNEKVAAWARDQLVFQVYNNIIPKTVKLNNIQLDTHIWKDNRAILKQPKRILEDVEAEQTNKEPRIL